MILIAHSDGVYPGRSQLFEGLLKAVKGRTPKRCFKLVNAQ